MPEQVWKCSSCSHTHKERSAIEQHEKECTYIEENKSCGTCDHIRISHYDLDHYCHKQDDHTVYDPPLNCPMWTKQTKENWIYI